MRLTSTIKDLEFDLRLTPVLDLGDFRIDLKANLSLLDSKVNSVYEGLDEIPLPNSKLCYRWLASFHV